jgi:RNA polymerase sigma-70 factor, ECF subfamily
MDRRQFDDAFPMALRVCEVHAFKKAAKGAVAWNDLEDLRQEGLLACWRAIAHFDRSRASLPTFLDRVVSNQLASVCRSSQTQVFQSLDAIDACTIGFGLCYIHLARDVARALHRLCKEDRGLAVALMEHTPTEISRRTGVARSTIYERIRRIRAAFMDAGLRPKGALRQ